MQKTIFKKHRQATICPVWHTPINDTASFQPRTLLGLLRALRGAHLFDSYPKKEMSKKYISDRLLSSPCKYYFDLSSSDGMRFFCARTRFDHDHGVRVYYFMCVCLSLSRVCVCMCFRLWTWVRGSGLAHGATVDVDNLVPGPR